MSLIITELFLAYLGCVVWTQYNKIEKLQKRVKDLEEDTMGPGNL